MRIRDVFIVSMLALTLPALAITEPPAPPAKKYSSAAAARRVNEFAFDLYRQLTREAKPDQNISFSPDSISAALAMPRSLDRGLTTSFHLGN